MQLNRKPRMLSVILIMMLLLVNLAIFGHATDEFAITCDGQSVTQVEFAKNSKLTVVAEALPEGSQYQWQIQIPGTDVWVDILDQTEQQLDLTYALLGSMLDSDNGANIRCAAVSDGTQSMYTEPVRAVVLPEQYAEGHYEPETQPPVFLEPQAGEEPQAETEVTRVTVYVSYHYVDRNGNVGEQVKDPYKARVAQGEPLNNVPVPLVVFPGYSAKLAQEYSGSEDYSGTVTLENNVVLLNLTQVSADVEFKVYYHEIKVPYYARYFMQNVYNDMYTERADIIGEDDREKMVGYAEEQPDPELIYPPVTGFSALFYQPERIAADGSTVFEVYYDRDYYLINFDLDGGFGTAPVYARYETSFSVSNPTKPGYKFLGWKLIKEDNTDINGSEIVEHLTGKIQACNQTYQAQWEPLETTYTVAYWLRKETDGKVNEMFLGNKVVPGDTDDEVDGKDDLDPDIPVCGLATHTHIQSCYTVPNHTHRNDCVNVAGLTKENTESNHNDITAIRDIGTPESGYLYTIHVENYWDTATYYKLYLDGQWYNVNSSYLSGASLGEGRYDTGVDHSGDGKNDIWVANKYYAQLPCGNSVKITCGLNHAHSASCYQDTRPLRFVEADQDVIVRGDGSTVVNVYYEHKEYTLKFYYAATTGGSDANGNGIIDANEYTTVKIVGGSSTYFGSNGTNTADDKTLLRNMYNNHGGEWGSVDELPQLNDEGKKRNYKTGTLVDDRNTPSDTSDDVTYHYIYFTAKYGDDISDLWPCGVFDSVTRTDKNTDKPSNGWSGSEAFASAWNGEHHVKYCYNSTGNQTIKGVYEELDDEILFKSDYADSTEVSYLCFWENGAEKKWNAPELYVYNIWLPFLGTDEEFGNLPEEKKKINPDNDQKYWCYKTFNTCDDSVAHEQTGISITGYEEDIILRKWSVYFIGQAKYGQLDGKNCFYVISDSWQKKYELATELDTEFGKVYSSSDSYNINMTVCEQANVSNIVETPSTSGTYLIYSDLYDPEHPGEVVNHTLYREAYIVDFYYKSNDHRIFYRNYNKNMGDGEGALVSYGKDLFIYGNHFTKDKMERDHYPDVLEPNAYEFIEWCLSPDCLEGTGMNWDQTMPDSDITVYAKWSPKVYTVNFYLDYDRLQQGDAENSWYRKTDVPHGEAMKDLEQNKILPKGLYVTTEGVAKPDYRFVGWFYINQDGKKVAFNPSEMAVRQDLDLYAEWSSTLVTSYTVYYKEGLLTTIDGQQVIVENPEGRELADPTTGFAFEATTRTFSAKSEDKLNKLDSTEKVGVIWVPHTNSHSILARENAEENVFTFYYVSQEEMLYTVRYLDATTHESLIAPKVVENNTDGAVVENFVYIPGYIPDAFHKSLVLSFDEDQNYINFYYSVDEFYEEDGDDTDDEPDTQSSRYLVTHYVQDIDSDTYSKYTTDDLVDIVGEEVFVDALEIPGFTYDKEKTSAVMGETVTVTVTETGVSGIVTTGKKGDPPLELKLYYSRNTYDYTVYYRLKDSDRELAVSKTVPNKYFDEEVEEDAIEITGYTLYSDESQTLKISTNEKLNVIVFEYVPQPFTINYETVCTVPISDDVEVGYVDTTFEYVTSEYPIVGTAAYANSGFLFKGWYSDKECTDKVSDKSFYKPNVNTDNGIYEYTYYALFEPIEKTLTINNQAPNGCTDTFLFRITSDAEDNAMKQDLDLIVSVQGSGTVIVNGLYYGEYTVTQLTGWSWTYASNTTTIQTADFTKADKITLQFGSVATTPSWLCGESPAKENIFE